LHIAHHKSHEILDRKISTLWDQASETIEEAIQKCESTIYGIQWLPDQWHLNPETKTIRLPSSQEAFLILGGRSSIYTFLMRNAEYSFQAGKFEKLALVNTRKKMLLGKNKTVIGVTCTGNLTGSTPIVDLNGGQGVLPLDTSGKTVSFPQLASIVDSLYGVAPSTKNQNVMHAINQIQPF
jgi:hypothetical protein